MDKKFLCLEKRNVSKVVRHLIIKQAKTLLR